MFHSTCDECATIRFDVARMIFEENGLRSEMAHAKRSQNVVLLQKLHENIDAIRRRRTETQRAYRLHRAAHSRAAQQIV
jgi:hypothetical protein